MIKVVKTRCLTEVTGSPIQLDGLDTIQNYNCYQVFMITT